MVFSTEHKCSRACSGLSRHSSIDDVCTFLEHIGQSKYCQLFKEKDVRGKGDKLRIDDLNYLRNELGIVDYFDSIIISRQARSAKDKERKRRNAESARRSRERRIKNRRALRQQMSQQGIQNNSRKLYHGGGVEIVKEKDENI